MLPTLHTVLNNSVFIVPYRVPCDENTHQVVTSSEQITKRPSVKRHKLGTTTISNTSSSQSEEEIGKLINFFGDNYIA